jgi:hypothetical protein
MLDACARMFAETRWGLAMSMYPRLLGIAAVIFGFGLSEALAASDVWKGSWKFEIERQRAIPYLTYYDTSGKPVFRIACGMHFEIDAVYPGASPKQDTTGSLTITNGKTQMDFAGFILPPPADPDLGFFPDLPFFNQPDLGDPEAYQAYEEKWHALENRFFDLLDSGQPLTISAEGKSYVLPPINVPRWRARFQKIC